MHLNVNNLYGYIDIAYEPKQVANEIYIDGKSFIVAKFQGHNLSLIVFKSSL